MEQYISMYIDNQLSLTEKGIFVREIQKDDAYFSLTLDLLDQARELDTLLNVEAPELGCAPERKAGAMVRVGWALAAMLVLALTFLLGQRLPLAGGQGELMVVAQLQTPHRFVIHQQTGQLVEIVGNFTNWQKLPLTPTGQDGYWEITLPLAEGEHRYSFIVDGKTTVPDPTVPDREADGFGSVNSILHVGTVDGRS